MLRRTLDVLAVTEGLTGVAVISPDSRVAEIVAWREVLLLPEPQAGGLNAALRRARQDLQARGAHELLVVPGDLPRLSRASIESALSLLTAPGMVIAPDRREKGTNLLLLAPPDLVPFHFGAGSFARFLKAAAQCGIDPVIVRADDIACDVDVPADLVLVQGLEGWSG
jgi:2-phospho-L-lactate guanylyltransferase